VALAAESAAVRIDVGRRHGYGSQQIGHIAGHDDRRNHLSGQFPVTDLTALDQDALDAPVLRVLHAAFHAFQQIAVPDGGDHVLQRIRTAGEQRVGHARIGLAFAGLAAAVAGRDRAQAQSAEQIGDAGLQDAAVDFRDIAGRRAFIVKGEAGRILRRQRPFMHGDHAAADALVDVVRSQRPVLDEHVHLHAVSEGFVRDQAADARGRDDVVLARLHPRRPQQLQGILNDGMDAVVHLIQQLQTAQIGIDGIITANILVFLGHGHDHALREQVALPHCFAGGQIQLGDMRGRQIGDALQDPRIFRGAFIADLLQPRDDFFRTQIFRQDLRLFFNAQPAFLFLDVRRRIILDVLRIQQLVFPLGRFADLLRNVLRVFDAAEGILMDALVPHRAHDAAALTGHRLHDHLVLLADPVGCTGRVRGKNADKTVFRFQQLQ